jgi:hypothetical protein
MLACKEIGAVSADESIGRISNLKVPEYHLYYGMLGFRS